MPRAPNFLMVGVQKSGTAFLSTQFSRHPDIFFAQPKELFFFNQKTINRTEFEAYCRKHFAQAGDAKWAGEKSTNYFHHKYAIRHIEKFLGRETPIIVCLRHPVERMLSHYLHDYKRLRRRGDEQLSDQVWRGYASRSLYADRLVAWGDRFPRFKAMVFDDLTADGVAFYAKAAAFLGITPQPMIDEPINEGLRLVWEGDTLTVSAPPGKEQVAPRLTRDEVEALHPRFAEDVERTGEFLGRDLSRWLRMPDFGRLGEKFADEPAG